MKYYVLATSSNYVFSFWLYCGKESGRNTDTNSIVLEFVNELEYYPYFIIADSYYGSVELAEKLHDRQVFFILGCQKYRPSYLFKNFMHKEKRMKKLESRWCSNGHLAALYFKDRAKVNFITNADIIDVEKVGSDTYLPKVVKIYRKHMGHVDKADAFLSHCLFSNRNRKWTDAHFKASLKFTVDNCWIIYNHIKNESISLESFIMKLACELVEEYTKESTQMVEQIDKSEISNVHVPVRSDKKSRCENCKPKKNDSKTNYICSECNVYLHIDCFAPFHDVIHK